MAPRTAALIQVVRVPTLSTRSRWLQSSFRKNAFHGLNPSALSPPSNDRTLRHSSPPPQLSRACSVIMRCLEKRPSARWQSAKSCTLRSSLRDDERCTAPSRLFHEGFQVDLLIALQLCGIMALWQRDLSPHHRVRREGQAYGRGNIGNLQPPDRSIVNILTDAGRYAGRAMGRSASMRQSRGRAMPPGHYTDAYCPMEARRIGDSDGSKGRTYVVPALEEFLRWFPARLMFGWLVES